MSQELKPCPFCGCSMKVSSNRDWHRAIGDHGEHCPLTGHEDLMMTPASDDQLALVLRDWNTRVDHVESVRAMVFEFFNPLSKERRSVTISKKDVVDGMEETLFEMLNKQICGCEPVGETSVVECNCWDYTDDFDLVADAPDTGGQTKQQRLLPLAFVQPHPPRHEGFLQPEREVPGYTVEQMKEYGAQCVAAFIKQNKVDP